MSSLGKFRNYGQDDLVWDGEKGVGWLEKNLPGEFGGYGIGGISNYILAIDDGRGKEVAAAIRSLMTVNIWEEEA